MAKGVPHDSNALDNAEKVPIEVLDKYLDFLDIFDKLGIDFLLKHSKQDMAIEFETGKMLLISCIYDLSHIELEVLKKYINKMLAKRFIISLKSPIGASILFSKKKK